MKQVHMVFDYETKGAVRYQEINANGKPLSTRDESVLIGTLYLRKAVLGKDFAHKICVTIEEE